MSVSDESLDSDRKTRTMKVTMFDNVHVMNIKLAVPFRIVQVYMLNVGLGLGTLVV